MTKKEESRFNIILNPKDPMHMTAIKALNAQGWHKAQFIVNAILHYTMADNTPSKPPDTEEIRSICREIISEMLKPAEHTPVVIIQDETTSSPSDQEFDYGAIADALNGFRKK